jgi:hypothetical protein
MKKIEIKESKALLEVRHIKEKIAREAEGDPGYYQRLNGQGAKLMEKYRGAESSSSAYALHDKPVKYKTR